MGVSGLSVCGLSPGACRYVIPRTYSWRGHVGIGWGVSGRVGVEFGAVGQVCADGVVVEVGAAGFELVPVKDKVVGVATLPDGNF
jgi:hypothetical protein